MERLEQVDHLLLNGLKADDGAADTGGWLSRGRTVIGNTRIAVRPFGSVAEVPSVTSKENQCRPEVLVGRGKGESVVIHHEVAAVGVGRPHTVRVGEPHLLAADGDHVVIEIDGQCVLAIDAQSWSAAIDLGQGVIGSGTRL